MIYPKTVPQLTEEVLRSFGQALKDSVQRGDLRLDLSSDGKRGVTVTPATTRTHGSSTKGGEAGLGTGVERQPLASPLTAP